MAAPARLTSRGAALRRPHRGAPRPTSGPRGPTRASAAPDDGQPDLVTRVFGALFGRAALEDAAPAGMKRLSGAALTEQYPATLELADPLPGDAPDVAPLRLLLKNTRLEATPLRLAYDADEHGWSSAAFLARVATLGANVVVCTSAGGAVFGGYAPRSWLGLGEEKNSNAAFLFTWPGGDTAAPAIKLPKVGGPGLALIDKPGAGPQFGAEGLKVDIDGQAASCRLGTYYAKAPGGGRSLFGPDEGLRCILTGLRVFVADGEPEAWKLDGVVWRSE